MRRVEQSELQLIIEMALANVERSIDPATRRERLVRGLVGSLNRLEIWRDEAPHEKLAAPLPLFPGDDMHLRGPHIQFDIRASNSRICSADL